MGNPIHLAMTAAEFALCRKSAEKIAWMACHFSPYGAGLSNIPRELPPESILIINDRIEPTCHDADLVALDTCEAVEKLQCSAVLLDFQRPDSSLTAQIAAVITAKLPCPVAVSHHYAKELPCAVFLPPPPLRCDLTEYFAPWQNRNIWLEVYEQWESVTVTEDSVFEVRDNQPNVRELPFWDEFMRCRYKLEVHNDRAVFTLHRGLEELLALPCSASNYIGLFQEYKPD